MNRLFHCKSVIKVARPMTKIDYPELLSGTNIITRAFKLGKGGTRRVRREM